MLLCKRVHHDEGFGAFQQHFVAQWASPLKVYHWSYIRYSFILLMAVDSPGWKADWIEIRVPQASQIHSHTNSQRSVTSAFGRFLHRELLRCWMETGVDVMQAESDGVRQAEMRDAVSTLLHPVSSRSVYWLTTSGIWTKYYHCNYNTWYIYIISCGLLPVRVLPVNVYVTEVWRFMGSLQGIINPFSRRDILTCYSRKSTGDKQEINDGWVIFSCLWRCQQTYSN